MSAIMWTGAMHASFREIANWSGNQGKRRFMGPSTPPSNDSSPRDPRVRLAAERTLLAWIRTGLAMMGFGFVVARFGLFLQEMAAVEHMTLHRPPGLSHWLGVGL